MHEALKIFSDMDQDGDGHVTREDLEESLTRAAAAGKIEMSAQDIAHTLLHLDHDGDKKISTAEFMSSFRMTDTMHHHRTFEGFVAESPHSSKENGHSEATAGLWRVSQAR